MPVSDLKAEVRKRVIHYISPEVAQSAGISFEKLRGFISGYAILSEKELVLLARRIGVLV